jgi:hypothetical protein
VEKQQQDGSVEAGSGRLIHGIGVPVGHLAGAWNYKLNGYQHESLVSLRELTRILASISLSSGTSGSQL